MGCSTKLVHIKLRQKNTEHKVCGGEAVLNCIENQLYKQKQAHDRLSKLATKLETNGRFSFKNQTSGVKVAIQEQIDALEKVDMSMSTLVTLFEEHVGRSPTKNSAVPVVAFFKNLFKSKFATVAIDDKTVENLKKNGKTIYLLWI